jgi:hypothetical protein
LKTGEADTDPREWPDANIIEKGRNQHAALSTPLIAEVRRRVAALLPWCLLVTSGEALETARGGAVSAERPCPTHG